MSTTVAKEIMSGGADYLVVNTVSPNWSPQSNSLFIREIARYSLILEQSKTGELRKTRQSAGFGIGVPLSGADRFRAALPAGVCPLADARLVRARGHSFGLGGQI